MWYRGRIEGAPAQSLEGHLSARFGQVTIPCQLVCVVVYIGEPRYGRISNGKCGTSCREDGMVNCCMQV